MMPRESFNVKGKDANPSMMERAAEIESSDSDSGNSVEVVGTCSSSGIKTSDINTKASKKVSFDNLKTGGKTVKETLTGKGTWSNVTANDGKSGKGGEKGAPPIAKVLSEVELKLEVDLPKNARILKDCEAAIILGGIKDCLPALLGDPMIKLPDSFDKSLKYVQTVDHYTDPLGVTRALQKLKKYGATDGEICMIANVCPEMIDEVYALIPSLKNNRDKNEGPIVSALAELSKLKRCE